MIILDYNKKIITTKRMDDIAEHQIIDAVKEQQETFLSWAEQSSRGAHNDRVGSWVENRHLSEVLEDLPKYQGRGLLDLLRSLPRRYRNVVDLGSGDNAVALSELVSTRPRIDGLTAVGVTLPLDRKDLKRPPKGVKVIRQDVDEFLHSINTGKGKKPNVIFAEKTLRWVSNPFSTWKQAYRALDVGGYLLIDEIYNGQMPLLDSKGKAADPKILEARLKKAGYEIEIIGKKPNATGVVDTYSIAMRKSSGKPTLRLPVKLVTAKELGLTLSDVSSRWKTSFRNTPSHVQFFYQLIDDEDT